MNSASSNFVIFSFYLELHGHKPKDTKRLVWLQCTCSFTKTLNSKTNDIKPDISTLNSDYMSHILLFQPH